MLVDTIAEAMWNEHVKLESGLTADWSDASPEERERFTQYAHAALRIMAVPTQEMLNRGNRALQAWDDSEHYRSPITGIYRAMVAAELPPEPAQARNGDYDEL